MIQVGLEFGTSTHTMGLRGIMCNNCRNGRAGNIPY